MYYQHLARRGLSDLAAATLSTGTRTWRPEGLLKRGNTADPDGQQRKGQHGRDDAIRFLARHETYPPSPPRGRYSGQPLRPGVLLNELEKSPSHGKPHRGFDKEIHRIARDNKGFPILPPRLTPLVIRFMTYGPDGARDAEAWQSLQSMLALEADGVNLNGLGKHSAFMKAYIGLTVRCCNRLTSHANASPKPSQVLELLPTFGASADRLWARALWSMSSGIVELNAGNSTQPDPAAYQICLQELMTLWNMCFASYLRRLEGIPSPSPAASDLDWTFLPNPVAFADALSQRQDDRALTTFEGSLSLLLPISNRRNLPNDRSRQVADVSSAALVTLDILRNAPGVDGYDAFVSLMESILRVVNTPRVPEALQNKLETTEKAEVKLQYGSIVERLGLAPVPSTETEGAWNATQPQHLRGRTLSRRDRVPSDRIDPLRNISASPSVTLDGASVQGPHLSPSVPIIQERAQYDSMTVSPSGSVPSLPAITSDRNPRPQFDSSQTLSSPSTTSTQGSQDSEVVKFTEVRIIRLGQAIQKQNLNLAEHIKDEVLRMASHESKPHLSDDLYEHLMLTLLSLRSPASAIQVWNHYIQLGRQPTAKTYTVMMRGAQHVRDVKGVEAFWNKMRGAGVQPDEHAWSVRVFGLVRSGKVEAGLKALSEMAQEWFDAARRKNGGVSRTGRHHKPGVPESTAADLLLKFHGPIDAVPRPTLEVMNSAVSALASRDDSQISKVIAWGRRFGLEPDRYTYNVLLNIAMRHGEADTATAILERMHNRGVEADSTTWTVLLTALFEGRSLDALNPEEQQARILSFMSSLETAAAAGIDAKGYALVIDRLLKFYSNSTAANAVLQQMTSRGMQPTAHIYTILMASYFERQPQPDFAAAEALWHHIQASDAGRGAGLDSYFYDRMIEGYATHHRSVGSEPMLRFLQDMTNKGKKPSWHALDLVARALAERSDWNRLLQIVDNARRMMRDESEGEFMVGEQKRFGQRDFWRFIISTGLLQQEGVTDVEQIVGKRDHLSTLERAERKAALAK